jgi:hypothetical protein
MLQQTLKFLNENSSAVTAFSVLTAGIVWVLKIPYDKHHREVVSLAKLEKSFALNEIALRDNIEFMTKWETAISSGRVYSCHFEKLFVDDLSTSTVSDLKLVNKLLKINYMMKRLSDDLANLYESYWEIIPQINAIPDPAVKEKNLIIYHQNILMPLGSLKENAELIQEKIIPVIAHLQVAGKVRFHSLFGYMQFLFLTDIIPRPTKKIIKSRSEALKKQFASLD